jgi:hypothetical protein
MNVSLVSLWLPILLSSIVVFIVSSLIWAVIQYHNSDWQKLPDEEAARAALRGASPGQYGLPHAASNADRNKPEFQERYKEGPAAMIYVVPHGTVSMNKQMVQWSVYCLAVSFLVAYVTSVALTAGADYLNVFRISGTVAVLTYAGAAPMRAIWFGQTWSASVKDVVDGLIYGLLTAGVFGWLWP